MVACPAGQELQDTSSCDLETIDFFPAERLGSVDPAGEEILPLKTWVVPQDF
jgi:hypothetical protein